MLFDRSSIHRPTGHQIAVYVGRGLRTHPLLTTVCIAAVAVICALALMLAVLAGLAIVAIAALGLVAYGMGQRLLQRPVLSRRHVARSLVMDAESQRTEVLRRYLAAVDEFSRLTDLALTQRVDRPARGRRARQMAADARAVYETARDLADRWRGDRAIAACMYELESASEALGRYLRLLQESGSRRHSPEALRWRREALGRARDALAEHLRAADFRAPERERRVTAARP